MMKGSGRWTCTEINNEDLIEFLYRTTKTVETGDSDFARLKEETDRRSVGLVKSIALKLSHSGEPLDDLNQAGCIGLLNAVSNSDPARNIRFSTYASYLIEGEMGHYIRDEHSTIRIPEWIQAIARRIIAEEEAFFQDEGRAYVERVGEASGLDGRATHRNPPRTGFDDLHLNRPRAACQRSELAAARRAGSPAAGRPAVGCTDEDSRRHRATHGDPATGYRRAFLQTDEPSGNRKELGISQRRTSHMKDGIRWTVEDSD